MIATARRALAVSRKRTGGEGAIATLLGSEATQTTAHATTTNKPEAFQFTASATGVIEEIVLETNGTANTGVTEVLLGVQGQETPTAAKPVAAMTFARAFLGAPGTNVKLTAAGLRCPVIAGGVYHLVVLSLGAPLHFNIAGGTGSNVRIGSGTMWSNSWGAAKAEGPAKMYARGKTPGTSKALIFGVQNSQNHSSFWVPKHCYVQRGLFTETNLAEAGEESPAELSAEIGTTLAAGFHYPIVLLDAQKLLSEVNATTFAEKAAAMIKRIREDHPSVTLFEIINEPQGKGPHGSNAGDYANIVKAVIEKCKAEGITGAEFLITASGDYQKKNSLGENIPTFSTLPNEEGWVHDMFAAQPSLKAGGANEIKAWVTHNYGRAAEITHETQGGFAAGIAIRESVIFNGGGGYNNWFMTEMGFANTGTASGRNVASETEQNTCTKEYVELAMLAAEAGWLTLLNIYADGEGEAQWQVYGKTAGTTFGAFALERGKS